MAKWKQTQKTLADFSFLVPALLIFGVMIVIPFCVGAFYSLTNWNGVSKTYKIVYFQNFITIFQDSRIWADTQHTVIFTILQTVTVNAVGLLLALAVKEASRFNRILRTMFFAPFMFSIVFAAFIWSYMYSDVGEHVFHITNPLSQLGTVIPGIALIALWRDAGFAMIVFLAALQAIPDSLYESADIDGATRLHKFFRITLPLIVPALTANITLFIGWGLKTFDYVMASTGGGPGSSSETIAMLVYYYTFPYLRTGLGQAFALVMMLSIFLITGVIARAFRSKEVEL